jgi:NTE family protein
MFIPTLDRPDRRRITVVHFPHSDRRNVPVIRLATPIPHADASSPSTHAGWPCRRRRNWSLHAPSNHRGSQKNAGSRLSRRIFFLPLGRVLPSGLEIAAIVSCGRIDHRHSKAYLTLAAIKKADGVFEGGGVKGIGLVGALSVVEASGYEWANLAGTSAGAIVAALTAAGYKAAELRTIIGNLDYTRFKDTGAVDRIPLFGPLISLLAEKGVFEGDYLKNWIAGLLAAKGIHAFGDLKDAKEKDPRYRYKLNVITSDITNGRLVVLPQALPKYSLEADRFPVAEAVRMSMSIPFFFEPVKLSNSYFVDGGILSNFPIWLFDVKGKPEWPTFGFKLIEPDEGQPYAIRTPIDFAKAIMTTMMEAHDKMHVEDEDFKRTIAIPTLGVRTTEFDVSPERREALYQSGVQAAETFLKKWNFSKYRRHAQERRHPRYQSKLKRLQSQLVR